MLGKIYFLVLMRRSRGPEEPLKGVWIEALETVLQTLQGEVASEPAGRECREFAEGCSDCEPAATGEGVEEVFPSRWLPPIPPLAQIRNQAHQLRRPQPRQLQSLKRLPQSAASPEWVSKRRRRRRYLPGHWLSPRLPRLLPLKNSLPSPPKAFPAQLAKRIRPLQRWVLSRLPSSGLESRRRLSLGVWLPALARLASLAGLAIDGAAEAIQPRVQEVAPVEGLPADIEVRHFRNLM
jgi:hypothetical protein